MIFIIFCILVHWTKVTSASEELIKGSGSHIGIKSAIFVVSR